MLRIAVLLILTALPLRAQDILVIGDSVAAWNGHGVAEAIEDILGAEVDSHARSGASISPVGVRRLLGPIGGQVTGGPWDWVVIVAGANDIQSECDCGRCGDVITSLVSPDGRNGEATALVDRVRATGARVVWADYYTSRRGLRSGDACLADWRSYQDRTRRMADARDGVLWVDMSNVVDPTDPSDFSRDALHPSAQASAKIGRLIANAIRSASVSGG